MLQRPFLHRVLNSRSFARMSGKYTPGTTYSYLLPHELLLRPIAPPPPTFTDSLKRPCLKGSETTNRAIYHLQVASKDEETLPGAVQKFSFDLRCSYPRRVAWPEDSKVTPTNAIEYFGFNFIHPVLNIIHQLRYPHDINPLLPMMHSSETNSHIVAFYSDDFDVAKTDSDDFECFEDWPNPPIIVLMKPGLLCGVKFAMLASSEISMLLDESWYLNPNSRVICTDLHSLVIFHPPSYSSESGIDHVVFEQAEPMSDLRTARIVLGSYIYRALPMFMDISLDFHFKNIPHGACIDPATPMKSDEEVFSSCHRHIDFDRFTLYFDRSRALQFLRWKSYMNDHMSPLIGAPGDVLSAITDGFSRENEVPSPLYPFVALSLDTMAYLNSIRRPCPLGPSRTLLFHSRSFVLQLEKEITPSVDQDHPRLCRTYTCRLTSVDGLDIDGGSPLLCLKVFDDRFFPFRDPFPPNHYGDLRFSDFGTAEDYISREIAVYRKLAFAQGSILPYFYGAHTFVMRDNLQLYGLLMEYVDAAPLGSGVAKSLTENQKKQLVQSVRHALRVLQSGDISQHDWHCDQILVRRFPATSPSDEDGVHCVLIDFASVTQSVEVNEHHRIDDFGYCIDSLVVKDIGLEKDLVLENFGRSEVWDLFDSWYVPTDPFAFVHTSENVATH